MAEKILNARIINKNGTSAEWAKAAAFVPKKGELILYTDLNKIKIGDGVSKVGELEFIYPEEICYIPVIITPTDDDYTATSSYTYEQVKALVDEGKNIIVEATLGGNIFYCPLFGIESKVFCFEGSVTEEAAKDLLSIRWSSDDITIQIDYILSGSALSNTDPLPSGTASPGTSDYVSRADHVHPSEVETISDAVLEEMWNPTHFLTFSSPEPFTLSVANATKNWDGTLEYSTDKHTWTEWDGTTTLNSENNKLYIRGTGNSVISGDEQGWKLSGMAISCFGNIETLLDWQTVAQGGHPSMAEDCYDSMFSDCTSLTTAPELPATTLANYCYWYMFSGCTSLTTAPELPATTLAEDCYDSMFSGCTSLTTVPELPATTLANYCYNSMFSDCTSLTTAPELPATTLANYCYNSMFFGCTSLTTAPELPATTLAEDCYDSMFSGCTSLTTVPELPATTLAEDCYDSMFSGCTSLTTVPELPATTLANYCYNSMFYGCSKIRFSTTQTDEYTQEYRIPTSGAGTTATGALNSMFSPTGGAFTGTPTINTTYYLHKDNSIVPAT